MKNHSVLGIDIGSISIAITQLDINQTIIKSSYCYHNGEVYQTLRQKLQNYPLNEISAIAFTSDSPNIYKNCQTYDTRVSIITAVKQFFPKIRSVLQVGGEKFSLISFDENGEYMECHTNSSCAAGTGSFLDQQAKRLNLDSIQEFSELAYNNTGAIPQIASRCAVFAKTDLIHAQQEGYSIAEICDGLSRGLAKNLCDSLFTDNPDSEILFVGGVSKNMAVRKHIEDITGQKIITTDFTHLFEAAGAALCALQNFDYANNSITDFSIDNILKEEKTEKHYFYEKLNTELTDYPDFAGLESFIRPSERYPQTTPVETDLYSDIKNRELDVYLGIDIGSTSTKAVLVDDNHEVIAGFYTRTSGKPVIAMQTIFETIDHIARTKKASFTFKGAGTTGSGRKFVGTIISADLILDEITAHARAAAELNPDVDTIIEIGGQDAKFTTLKNGMVTFSVMNNVCAAGTGSFIEEQAGKLGCPVSEYAQRAGSSPAPLSSDRCTVFMERDLNYYLNAGYSNAEILTAVLHSVRDNYLSKVAVTRYIGDTIFFQGATAKNRALVAAFQYKLGKRIVVSKFCHLTGALGVALQIIDSKKSTSTFSSIEIYKADIPIKNEICTICTNHCKIRIADINGTVAAFGFMCGRDYETESFVSRNNSGYALLKERDKIQKFASKPVRPDAPVIGIPAALHVFEELPLWQFFFNELEIKTVTSIKYKDGVSTGKKIAGAEFCAPISNLYGHVDYLAKNSDYVFLPTYLEEKQKDRTIRRHYCYYTQFIPAIIENLERYYGKNIVLSPVIKSLQGSLSVKLQLYNMIRKIYPQSSLLQIASAYDHALDFYEKVTDRYCENFANKSDCNDINIVLLGRPYTTLVPSMNKGIIQIFENLGIKTFYQDMIPQSTKAELAGMNQLLQALHWNYGAKIIECSATIAQTKNLYPVLVTSFKCTPDSFVAEYYKNIFEAHNKPYLILQLDEHDSNVGYETRIESAVRSFRNHYEANHPVEEHVVLNEELTNISKKRSIVDGKTLLMPCWDPINSPLMQARLIQEGIDARLIPDTTESIQKSLQHNTGQCIPLNIIAQNSMDYIRTNNLNAADCVLWMFDSSISCNVRMYPYYLRKLLQQEGGGMENLSVYIGELAFTDFSYSTAIDIYFAHMFGGLLRKMGCKLRPYEKASGSTDRAIDESVKIFFDMFKTGTDKEEALEKVISLLETVEITPGQRPKVALFGDLYVRDNDIMNQGLIKMIEANGGEVVTTPYNEYLKLIASPYIRKWITEGLYSNAAIGKIIFTVVNMIEKKYSKYFNRILKDEINVHEFSAEKLLAKYNIKPEHSGESMDNILKICTLAERYPDISLFVQTNPAFCCPSLVTEAMSQRIEADTGIPIVTIEYDGTGGLKNSVLIPYLKFPRKSDTNAELEDEESAV
ncbi:MAG: acyl-CoA dehydratase activase [Spirochaetes bacterium]|jgi:predicted CoA-substrate-specific enzyme activase|nr:acyl-CoA dehydratase activase [Spirochaetota bacterium]